MSSNQLKQISVVVIQMGPFTPDFARFVENCKAAAGNIEFLFVLDGGAKTLSYLDQYQSACSVLPKARVLIDETCSGSGHARQVGIQAATSEYIGFADADDAFDPNQFVKMLDCLLAGEADVAVCNYQTLANGVEKRRAFPEIERCDGKEAASFCLTWSMGNCFWNKLFKASLLADAYLPRYCVGEDMSSIPFILAKAGRVVFLQEKLYTYYIFTSSTSHCRDVSSYFAGFWIHSARHRLAVAMEDQRAMDVTMRDRLSSLPYALVVGFKLRSRFPSVYREMRLLLKECYAETKKAATKKQRLVAFLCRRFPLGFALFAALTGYEEKQRIRDTKFLEANKDYLSLDI